MDREAEGRAYLAQHKIPELLHNLSALLLYHRPDRPREFLIKTLEKIKYAKITSTDFPYLMDESNVDAMFEMLDVAGQGYITIPQYKGALESLGLSIQDEIYEETDIMTAEEFRGKVMKKFAEMWGAF
ncbi:EF-hand calcium-binding domain-containing protein 10 isoform X1 [Podarcis raffonei]|uniref:EF-hand calcium-binding domain-containing protein 10 isoform X1 n=1 Tax=Podarcis raffonei TaxID=65483 RepID=UPI0023299E60|nr:EF-hand calcium-binding domain-containing protein 10 isoform X1 [Podarcis raffonei]